MQAASLRTPSRSHDSRSIERLTQQALEASQAGDWEKVDACYTEREASLKTCLLDPSVAQRLLAIDERIRAAVLVAQAGIAGLLADNARMRRELRRLADVSRQAPATSGVMHLEA
ncbi:MAG: hypothetical protein K0S45_3427 [Nitrospira sp.]|jgi:hypothetical protein|nr:hypothetical protein [Nitrospira sp.]